MRLFSLLIICIVSFILCTCNNLEDASISSRNTFLKIYEGPYSIVATDLEIVSDGFVVLGNSQVSEDSVATIIFKTDKQGNRISPYYGFGDATAKSFKHFSGGYIIVGDSITTNLASPLVENIEVASARVIILDEDFANPVYRTFSDTTVHDANPYIADYYGESVTVAADGRVIFLGTYREGVESQLLKPLKPFVFALTPTLNRDWIRRYDLVNRNYDNARSIHFYNEKVYWASSIERVQGDLTFSYVSVPVVQNESVFINYSLLGETSDQLYKTNDIQPSKNPAFGFGVIGTYSQTTDGSQSNIFFLRTDASGSIIPSTVRYYDAIGSAKGAAVSSTESQIIDSGEAITSTADGGFVLAGTYESNPQLGEGLKDIFLIKLDFEGNTIWVKTFGGSGNEEVVSIMETNDKGFLICGTSTIGTYATPILIKTDKNGELKN
jgi:hypothetical protein